VIADDYRAIAERLRELHRTAPVEQAELDRRARLRARRLIDVWQDLQKGE
jgi:hypothetical protein